MACNPLDVYDELLDYFEVDVGARPDEVARLRRSLVEAQVIGVAIGVVMMKDDMSYDTAVQFLHAESVRRGMDEAAVAVDLLASREGDSTRPL